MYQEEERQRGREVATWTHRACQASVTVKSILAPGRGGGRTPTPMMLDESEEGAGEEDGEADGRTEKEREHGAGISAASGAAAGVDPPPPAPQATEQDDQPAAPRGRAVHHLFPKWRGDDPPTDLEEDLEAGFMGTSLQPAGDGARVGRPGQLGRARA